MTEPPPVIISGDGSAEIEGVPVPVVPGEPVDVAILDTLHGYARSRDAPVTASITDPDAGYTALIRVDPDGSSTLLEQHRDEEDRTRGRWRRPGGWYSSSEWGAAFTPTPSPKPKSPPEPDPAIPTGVTLIKNKKYGFCVDLPGTGKGKPDGRVQDGACEPSGADNQRWTLERRVKGGGTRGGADLYLIRNAKDGLCFDLPNYGPVRATTPVTEYHCDGTDDDNQLWWLDRRPDGAFWIRNQKSGDMCLDVARTDNKTAHTNATLYPCSDTDDHRWVFRTP